MRIIHTALLGTLLSMTSAAREPGPLPVPDLEHGATLMRALAQRRSSSVFDSRPLDRQMLSDLLWAAWGINGPDGRRTVPSVHNWQAMDVYLLEAEGAFRYEAEGHRLSRISDRDLREEVYPKPFVRTAPSVLVFVADLDRMRGGAGAAQQEFYAATDAGFISQNVYLFCSARDLHTVVLDGVNRSSLAAAMGLRDTQRIILAQAVGYPPAVEPPAAEAPSDGFPLRPGTFRGIGAGYEGEVEVEVRIADGRIVAVDIVREQETVPDHAFQGLPARIVEEQGTKNVTATTGATITAQAIFDAVEQALRASRGETEEHSTPTPPADSE